MAPNTVQSQRRTTQTYQSDEARKSVAQRPGWESVRQMTSEISKLDPAKVTPEKFGEWLDQRGVKDDPALRNVAWDAYKAYHQPGQFSPSALEKNLSEAKASGSLNPNTANALRQDLTRAAQTNPSSPMSQLQRDSFDTKSTSKVQTPYLDNTIKTVEIAAGHLPDGPLKSSLETAKTTLELIREAKKGGRTAEVAKLTAKLGQNVLKTAGEIVGQLKADPKAAEEAANALGSIAKTVGTGLKYVNIVDNVMKAATGKSLTGQPQSTEQRVTAAVDLATNLLPPPIRAGISISRAELELLYKNVYAPSRQAISSSLTSQYLGGDPEQLKNQLRNRQITPENAGQQLYDLWNHTFDKGGIASMPNLDAQRNWEKFLAHNQSMTDKQQMETLNRYPSSTDPAITTMRARMAERVRQLALQFVDQEVGAAR